LGRGTCGQLSGIHKQEEKNGKNQIVSGRPGKVCPVYMTMPFFRRRKKRTGPQPGKTKKGSKSRGKHITGGAIACNRKNTVLAGSQPTHERPPKKKKEWGRDSPALGGGRSKPEGERELMGAADDKVRRITALAAPRNRTKANRRRGEKVALPHPESRNRDVHQPEGAQSWNHAKRKGKGGGGLRRPCGSEKCLGLKPHKKRPQNSECT